MPSRRTGTILACLGSSCLLCGSASGQFIGDFSGPSVALDPKGIRGWRHATGDGAATVELRQGGDGFASIVVDATRDRRNVWWALIERNASGDIDLGRMGQPGTELRIEARIRVSHAPRRVNLQLVMARAPPSLITSMRSPTIRRLRIRRASLTA